jgi:hypothetical protein
MTKDEYEQYRESPHWILVSRHIRQMRKKCERCAFPYELNVHHLNYDRLGKERDTDLILLCRSCHSREHLLQDLEGSPLITQLLQAMLDGKPSDTKRRFKQQQEEAKNKNLEREFELQKKRYEDDNS